MIFDKKSCAFIVVAVIIVIFVYIFSHRTQSTVISGQNSLHASQPNYEYVVLGGKSFNVEVARTEFELERGLSGHKPLADNEGMIFVFSKPDRHGFWMKDMNFPIDILWIDENFKIVHIEKSVLPQSFPKVFYPEASVLYVLEISAGLTSDLLVKVGDQVVFSHK